ncbi:NAD-dependent phenylacetaldehyde dehydrogenase [Burkholderia oklahomensis]|uniref:Aldehyde dehydrogenase family protein n=1 Tax=Burkholderia oklahomensis TaxID=342113 RepID=A0AAI8FQS8_9BURK|nr:NAD-dependent phenylacetaldehyde dehydrogenase [Burkholderia oklahomensis]AIO69290.1 aldehyde dehydrogenase family protein [Burkholderia oklahomensis]AOI38401.1 NAD-dependent phenylacetaldehyde dehydrogenase [Burkholderia oklahomensis EO147]KUY48476.1 NAD-dependent phenylacetaldehyde dehydrogenase [Burkholderia oklahomensis EO147]QPS41254.1 NAD-dependent phenylacetaldehyde dehydrogenase [Burkholderia oklahomensis]
MSDIPLLPEVFRFLTQDHAHFVGGASRAGASDHRIAITNPATEQTIAHVRNADAADVDAAVAAAKAAFHGAWRDTSAGRRAEILNRLADLIEQHGEEIAQLETLCSGKHIHVSRAIEVAQSATFLRYYAGWATKINGETIAPSLPSRAGERYTALTFREPVGVVAGIVPWNFSVMIAIWKIASALVTGCTVVIKPSEFSPLTLLRLAELATEAGVPPGALNVVNGDGNVGRMLIDHADVAKVSFTGSVATGIRVGTQAIGANLTRATLELGGKNAAGFLEDVDVDDAVSGLLTAGYTHQGQICASPERVYVHRSKLDEVLEKVKTGLQAIRVGSPLDESVAFGPLANKPHLDKILGYFDWARENGEVVFGGRRVDRPGYFVEPTAVLAKHRDDRLLHEETFGPVISFLPYDTDDELVSLFNDTPFGLTASLWTNNLSKALRLIPRIEAGTLWVNMHTFLDPAVPFGGVKSSGLGREFGSAFIHDYTELKSVMIRY